MSLRIRSGGQTGVDRAALDAALAFDVGAGGWCPAGRWAEDGPIPSRYPLVETPEADPAVRTRRNVRDSDATLVLSPLSLRGGTALTGAEAARQGRPFRALDVFAADAVPEAVAWIRSVRASAPGVLDLNVAGPRESEAPGIDDAARRVLNDVLTRLGEGARR